MQAAVAESRKDGLVQAGMFDEAQALDVNDRVERLQSRCASLSTRTHDAVERFERAVGHLAKYRAEQEIMRRALERLEAASNRDDGGSGGDDRDEMLERTHEAAQKAAELAQLLKEHAVSVDAKALEVRLRRRRRRWRWQWQRRLRRGDQPPNGRRHALATSRNSIMLTAFVPKKK